MDGVIFDPVSRTAVFAVGLGIAAFLTLTWMLRGAPFGQISRYEGEAEETSRGYRDRAVSMAAIGVLLVAAGAWLALRVSIPWSIGPFGAGFLLLLRVLRQNKKYRHESPTLLRVVNFADSALNGSLLAGVLIVGNVLAFQYGERPLDFTRERAFSLERTTVKQLQNLENPLHFTVFNGRSVRSKSQLDRVIQLLDLYRDQNPRLITYEVLNPYVDKLEFEQLVAQAPDVAMTDGGGLVVRLGTGENASRLVVRNADMFGGNAVNESTDRFASEFHGEDVLTSALIRLSEKNLPKIGFLTGHGEPPLDELDPRKPGLGILKARLEAIGSEVVALDLAASDVPDGLAVLIVVAPNGLIEPREAQRLENYVKRGGHAVLMLNGSNAVEWNPWLNRFNLQLRRELVLDSTSNVMGRPWLPRVFIRGTRLHSIVESLRNEAVVFPQAAPIEILKSDRTIRVTPLMRTGPEAWGEADANAPRPEKNRDRDLPGPLIVAAAVSETAKPPAKEKPRIVLFSSAEIAENRWVYRGPNLDLVINSIAWLRERNDLQGLAPRTHVALTLKSDRMLNTRMVVIPTLIAVSAIVGLGLATYLARRT